MSSKGMPNYFERFSLYTHVKMETEKNFSHCDVMPIQRPNLFCIKELTHCNHNTHGTKWTVQGIQHKAGEKEAPQKSQRYR